MHTNVLSLNHLKTIPLPPSLMGKSPSMKPALVPKMLGTAALKHPQHSVKSQWWELVPREEGSRGSGALTRNLPQGMYLGLCPIHHLWSLLEAPPPQMLRSLLQLADPETQVEQYRDPEGSPSPKFI